MPEGYKDVVELRCPNGPGDGRLFMKLLREGQGPVFTDGNLMEFSCGDCTRTLRKAGKQVTRVLHRYNFLGQMVESVVVT